MTSLTTVGPRNLQLSTFWLYFNIDMESSQIKVRRLRKAYQKVFMPTIPNESSFEDRLAELVSISAHILLLPPCVHVFI